MGSKVRPVPRLGNRRGRVVSGQGQNRTADTRIFSPLLYQLSYLAEPMQEKNLAGRVVRWECRCLALFAVVGP